MAQIFPDGWRELEVTGAAQREIETLAILADGLPDEYTVYHAVHWTNVEQRYALYGEIDFAIVNQAGDLLLIEQKSGFPGGRDGDRQDPLRWSRSFGQPPGWNKLRPVPGFWF